MHNTLQTTQNPSPPIKLGLPEDRRIRLDRRGGGGVARQLRGAVVERALLEDDVLVVWVVELGVVLGRLVGALLLVLVLVVRSDGDDGAVAAVAALDAGAVAVSG